MKNRKKKLFTVTGFLLAASLLVAQQVYVNFEDMMMGEFVHSDGELNTEAENPAPDEVNDGEKCAEYKRSDMEFDNVKLHLKQVMPDVSTMTTDDPDAPKMTMKIYTEEAPGTVVEMQLGTKDSDEFPAGVHSIYRATITTQNAWEELTFEYSHNPEGGMEEATNINKITILFNPGSKAEATYYFDEISGPELVPVGASAK